MRTVSWIHQDGGYQLPFSTGMRRDDARTVSFSWINVAADKIDFCYHPVSPCSLWPDAGRVSTDLEMSRTPR